MSDSSAPPPSRGRRRRNRGGGRRQPAAGNPASSEKTSAPAASSAVARPRRAPGKGGFDSGERGLRDLVGAGPSQLGTSRALRARDVNRPTDQDLADAERDTVIVRRNWKATDPT